MIRIALLFLPCFSFGQQVYQKLSQVYEIDYAPRGVIFQEIKKPEPSRAKIIAERKKNFPHCPVCSSDDCPNYEAYLRGEDGIDLVKQKTIWGTIYNWKTWGNYVGVNILFIYSDSIKLGK
jgi:hypothetical protein